LPFAGPSATAISFFCTVTRAEVVHDREGPRCTRAPQSAGNIAAPWRPITAASSSFIIEYLRKPGPKARRLQCRLDCARQSCSRQESRTIPWNRAAPALKAFFDMLLKSIEITNRRRIGQRSQKPDTLDWKEERLIVSGPRNVRPARSSCSILAIAPARHIRVVPPPSRNSSIVEGSIAPPHSMWPGVPVTRKHPSRRGVQIQDSSVEQSSQTPVTPQNSFDLKCCQLHVASRVTWITNGHRRQRGVVRPMDALPRSSPATGTHPPCVSRS